MAELLFKESADWSEAILERAWHEIEVIAAEDLKQTYYPERIEVITAKQMLDAYTSVGLPTYYRHWSFGKEYVRSEEQYKNGQMGLAYEIVVNSNPCVAYLMEENSALTQTLVMAHASVGHSAVFKHNYALKQAGADGIIDYLRFAKRYISQCEERYGYEEVEAVIDAAHSLQSYGVDRHKKLRKLSPQDEEARALQRFDQETQDYDVLWEKTGKTMQAVKNRKAQPEKSKHKIELDEPQENILYFIEKNAPTLPAWKRELIRIVRIMAQYFSPQGQTKTLNEGYATFVHYYIIHRLYDKGLLDEGSMVEFFTLHYNVVLQRPYTAINPYKLGFEIFMDIKRICEAKPEELSDDDRQYGYRLIGKDWREETHKAMADYTDESFILQFLTPRVAERMGLFSLFDAGSDASDYIVMETSRPHSFAALREKLAAQYQVDRHVPDIKVTGYDKRKNKRLYLTHFMRDNRPLDLSDAEDVLSYIERLWEHPVTLKTWEEDEDGGLVQTTIDTDPELEEDMKVCVDTLGYFLTP